MILRYFFISIIFVLMASCDEGMEPDENPMDNDKSEWIRQAYQTIKSEDRIKSVGWWNENWVNEDGDVFMKINSSESAQFAFSEVLSDPYFISKTMTQNGKVIPIENQAYNSAFLGVDPNKISQEELDNAITDFESLSNKELAMITCSSIWTDAEGGIHAPIQAIQNIAAAGKTPIMYIEPWSEFKLTISEPDPKYNMSRIINGDWDTELTEMAMDIKALGIPIMAVFGHEVNGSWFPWNGKWNGGEETTGFGDPDRADGPERFVAAYRHIIDLYRANDVLNVTWVSGLDYNTYPEEPWNLMAQYYPGDDYIDWIGLSMYGPQNSKDENQFTFSFIWDYIQAQLQEMGSQNPIIILEMGAGE